MKTQLCKGFTLIELMITVVIASILMALAVPSFVDLTRRNAIASESNRLLAALQLAKVKAMTGSFEGQVLPGNGDDSFSSAGYKVQAKQTNADAFVDVQVEAAPSNSQIAIQASDVAKAALRFNRLGRTIGVTGARYTVCFDDKSTANVPGIEINVSTSGRFQSQKMGVVADCSPNTGGIGN
jgi:type IV fimbrial biogenesis protein FimT